MMFAKFKSLFGRCVNGKLISRSCKYTTLENNEEYSSVGVLDSLEKEHREHTYRYLDGNDHRVLMGSHRLCTRRKAVAEDVLRNELKELETIIFFHILEECNIL